MGNGDSAEGRLVVGSEGCHRGTLSRKANKKELEMIFKACVCLQLDTLNLSIVLFCYFAFPLD